MTCTTIMFLPDEDPEVFFAEVRRWARQLGAVTEPEMAQVERAVYNRWKQRRARNADAAAITRTVENHRKQYYKGQHERLLELVEQFPRDPRASVRELEGISLGAKWILLTIEGLFNSLKECGLLRIGKAAELVRLTGACPSTLFDNRRVMEILLRSVWAEYGADGLTPQKAAWALDEARLPWMLPDDFARRLEPHLARQPHPPEDSRAYFTEVLERMHQDTTRLVEKLTVIEDREIQLDIVEAKCDIGDKGRLRSQYEATADRQQDASLRTLRALQRDRREFGEGVLENLDEPASSGGTVQPAVAQGGPEAPATAAAPRQQGRSKNEPTVPQPAAADEGCVQNGSSDHTRGQVLPDPALEDVPQSVTGLPPPAGYWPAA
jgi:hypothetical protein